MDQQDIEKLRAAGYSDDDIRDYMSNQPKTDAEATQTEPQTLPEVDVNKPSEILQNAERVGNAPGQGSGSIMPDVMALGAAAAPYALPVAGAGLGLYGAAKVGGWGRNLLTAAQEAAGAYKTGVAQNAATQEFRALERMARGAGPEADMARQRLQELMRAQGGMPQAQPAQAGRQAFQQMGQQLAKPVVPTGPVSTGPVVPQAPAPVAQGAQMAEQAAARAPSLLDKTTSMIRQLAANKVMQGLGKGLTGLQLATYSPELGPQTPQVGRMRGMEINPMTGRAWTKEQIAQYSANPSLFDNQLPAAQMQR